MQKKFNIEVDCANCAAKIENALNKMEGVNRASVSFMTQKLVLDADEAIAQVLDYSYKAFTKLDITAAKKIEPDFEIEL